MPQSIDQEIDRVQQSDPPFPPLEVQHPDFPQRVGPAAFGGAAPARPQPDSDAFVYLIGRPPMEEFLGYVQAQTANGSKADIGGLASEWRRANDHIRDLERREAGWADNGAVAQVSRDLDPLRQAVLNNPLVRTSYAVVPAEIGMVELDRLVVFQKQINLELVRRIQNSLSPRPAEKDIFNVCLPLSEPTPPFQVRRVAPGNAFVFVSPSTDLRFLDCTILESTQIDQYQPNGRVAGVVGLVVGFSANCFCAIRVEGRLILHNGSHRAFALREKGITHAPCLVQRVSRREELPLVASPDVNNNPDQFLKAPRPPVLKDYFDPKLRKLVEVPRRSRQVKVAFGVENIDI